MFHPPVLPTIFSIQLRYVGPLREGAASTQKDGEVTCRNCGPVGAVSLRCGFFLDQPVCRQAIGEIALDLVIVTISPSLPHYVSQWCLAGRPFNETGPMKQYYRPSPITQKLACGGNSRVSPTRRASRRSAQRTNRRRAVVGGVPAGVAFGIREVLWGSRVTQRRGGGKKKQARDRELAFLRSNNGKTRIAARSPSQSRIVPWKRGV